MNKIEDVLEENYPYFILESEVSRLFYCVNAMAAMNKMVDEREDEFFDIDSEVKKTMRSLNSVRFSIMRRIEIEFDSVSIDIDDEFK